MHTAVCVLDCLPQSLDLFADTCIDINQEGCTIWLVNSKGGINMCAIVRDEFGLGALSSHAASKSRPSTIGGISVVREGGIITAMNVGWSQL